MKTCPLSIVLIVLLPILGATKAGAVLIAYEISGTLTDGGTFDGEFTIDTGAADGESDPDVGFFDPLPGIVEFTNGVQNGRVFDSFSIRQMASFGNLTWLFFAPASGSPPLIISFENSTFTDPNVLAPFSGDLRQGNIGETADVTSVTISEISAVADMGSTAVMLGMALAATITAAGVSRRKSRN